MTLEKIKKVSMKSDEEHTSEGNHYANLVKASQQSEYKKEFYPNQTMTDVDDPFAWIDTLPPARKNLSARVLIINWLNEEKDMDAKFARNRILCIEDDKFILKFSRLWELGYYKFQQIKQKQADSCDYFLFFGISSDRADLWFVESQDFLAIWDDVDPKWGQHTGATAKETKWIEMRPKRENHSILRGGDIDKGYELLREELNIKS